MKFLSAFIAATYSFASAAQSQGKRVTEVNTGGAEFFIHHAFVNRRLAKWGWGDRDLGLFGGNYFPDQVWRFENYTNAVGTTRWYIKNVGKGDSKLAIFNVCNLFSCWPEVGSVYGVTDGGYDTKTDQEWTISNDGTLFYIRNEKWNKYVGINNRDDIQLTLYDNKDNLAAWYLEPRFESSQSIVSVWALDNRGGNSKQCEKTSYKRTDSEMDKTIDGGQWNIDASLTASYGASNFTGSVEGNVNAGYGKQWSSELSIDKEEIATKEKEYCAPAKTNYAVYQTSTSFYDLAEQKNTGSLLSDPFVLSCCDCVYDGLSYKQVVELRRTSTAVEC